MKPAFQESFIHFVTSHGVDSIVGACAALIFSVTVSDLLIKSAICKYTHS